MLLAACLTLWLVAARGAGLGGMFRSPQLDRGEKCEPIASVVTYGLGDVLGLRKGGACTSSYESYATIFNVVVN